MSLLFTVLSRAGARQRLYARSRASPPRAYALVYGISGWFEKWRGELLGLVCAGRGVCAVGVIRI